MTGYLQRLFDRGGALAAPSGESGQAAILPALAARSPVVGFDQRLTGPDRALDFGILGATPEALEGDWAAEESEFRAEVPRRPDDDVPRAPPMPRPAAPADPQAPRLTLPAATPADPQARVPAAERTEQTHPRAPDVRARREVAAPPAPAPGPAAIPAPVPEMPKILPAERSSAPPPAGEVAFAPVIPEFAKVDRRAPANLEPAATPAAVRPLDPAPAALAAPEPEPAPGPRQAEPRAAELVPAQPLPPPPLAAPARPSLDLDEVERIVRESVRAELAEAPARRSAGPGTTTVEEAPAAERPRAPATAREASLIGDLEPSTRPMGLFGLRLR